MVRTTSRSLMTSSGCLRFAATVSRVPEQRREQQDDERGPGRVHWQVRGLPRLERAERFAPAQEPGVEPRRPCEADQQDQVFAERRDTVRREAELRDA